MRHMNCCRALLCCLVVVGGLTAAANCNDPKSETKLTITAPKKDQELEPGQRISVEGTHKLSPKAHVWVFLIDITGGYYVQNGPAEMLADGTWSMENARPGAGIRYIVAILVNDQGHERIQSWAKAERFGKIEKDEVTAVPGYEELARVRVVTPDP